MFCVVGATNVIVSMVPVDSFQLATIRYGGYAVRNATTGIYSYVSGGSMSTSAVSACHGGGGAPNITADTITMGNTTGKVLTLNGTPPAGTVAGSMAFIWQTVRYSFDSSRVYPNRAGLYRIVSGATTADTSELIAPFSWTARFSYYTNPAQAKDTATNTAPTNLNTLRGFKIFLPAEASDTVPGRNGPQKTPMSTAVFFKNTRTQ